MVRLRNPHGVVVVVDEATAAALSGYVPADKAAPKPAEKRAPARTKK